MVDRERPEVVDALLTAFGDDLQAVAAYDLDGYEVLYLRDDLDQTFSSADIESIWEYVSIEKFNTPVEEGLYEPAHPGEYVGTMRFFEETVVGSFRFENRLDLYVAFDPHADPRMSDVLELCSNIWG